MSAPPVCDQGHHHAAGPVALPDGRASQVAFDTVQFSREGPQRLPAVCRGAHRPPVQTEATRPSGVVACFSGLMHAFPALANHLLLLRTLRNRVKTLQGSHATVVLLVYEWERVDLPSVAALTADLPGVSIHIERQQNGTLTDSPIHPMYHGIRQCGSVIRGLEERRRGAPFAFALRMRYDAPIFDDVLLASVSGWPIWSAVNSSLHDPLVLLLRKEGRNRLSLHDKRCLPRDAFFVARHDPRLGDSVACAFEGLYDRPMPFKATHEPRDVYEATLLEPFLDRELPITVLWSEERLTHMRASNVHLVKRLQNLRTMPTTQAQDWHLRRNMTTITVMIT